MPQQFIHEYSQTSKQNLSHQDQLEVEIIFIERNYSFPVSCLLALFVLRPPPNYGERERERKRKETKRDTEMEQDSEGM